LGSRNLATSFEKHGDGQGRMGADARTMGVRGEDHTHRRIAWVEVRPACDRSSAATLASATRTQTSTCKAPRPRSNSVASRCCSRSASLSAPTSVSAVRWFIAHWRSGRHNAMRWFQLSRVVLSEANSRTPLPGSMRIPPRPVMTARATSLRDRVSGSSASRANSAIAPNVPKLQFVQGSAIWAARNSKLLTTWFTAVLLALHTYD
jgi:hypothetical protein